MHQITPNEVDQLVGNGYCFIHTHPREPLGPVDYIDFTGRAFPSRSRRVGWNATDQTLELVMEHGVTQQIGQETYARVFNDTLATIPNGSVVGFAGAASNAIKVQPYTANGLSPSLYVLGVMTHELAPGEFGYCTVWGFVRDLDTSAFIQGDILYSSPTTSGGLTKIKPTASNNVVPVAVCIASSATNGIIFVRPTIEQMKYYGVFSDTTTQAVTGPYVPRAITFNTSNSNNGVVIGTPNSRIVVPQSGLYQFTFSAQVESSSASNRTMWFWPRLNGTDVPASGGEVTISGGGTVLVPSWSWTMPLNANDYFQLMYATDDTSVILRARLAQTGATGTVNFARPSVPSVILEVTQVQQ